jgi:hypothetical protein
MAAIPLDLLDRIRTLERQVRQLSGRANMRPALNRIRGPVAVGDGGFFAAYAPNGNLLFATGQWPNGRYGVSIRREGGPIALDSGADGSSDGMIRIRARDTTTIVMDDAYADRFLGRPWIPFPLHPTPYTTLDGTADWQFAFVGRYPAQNAVLVLSLSSWCSSGGQVRVNYAVGSGTPQTIDSWTATAGTWTSRTITHPLDGASWGSSILVQIEHRNSTSQGAIQTRLFTSYTRNTITPDEVPAPPTATPAEASDSAAPEPAPETAEPPAPGPGLRLVDEDGGTASAAA